MEINIGMTRVGLRKLADEIIEQLDAHRCVAIERYVQHNESGPELKLVLNNDDMDGDHIPSPDTMLWEQF